MKRNCITLFLYLLSLLTLNAQERGSAIFLGDTIHIHKDEYKAFSTEEKTLIERLSTMQDAYVVKGVGYLPVQQGNKVLLDPLNDGVTKVLLIGNSFSDDGVEYYLHEMARALGKPLVIGNLFRGGAPLDFHLKNAREDNKIYSYRKTTVDGIKTNTDKTSISNALKDENWDYICFQQASVSSGDVESVKASLPDLYAYIKKEYPINSVKFLYHQTWAYAQNAVTPNFKKYNSNQKFMFEKIVEVSREIKNIIPLHSLIPSGTAIQNGRTSFIGDNFTREGYHLDLVIGRYTAAATWFEVLFGDVGKSTFRPANLAETEANIAKMAASFAVKKPFEVTELIENKMQELSNNSFSRIKINFGNDLLIPGWLALLYERKGSARYRLMDENNYPTNVNIQVTQDFTGRKADGPERTSYHTGIPSGVSKYYFTAELDKQSIQKPFLIVENLDNNKAYRLRIISAVQEPTSITVIRILGKQTKVVSVDPSFNMDKEMIVESISPNQDGKLEIFFELPSGKQSSIASINSLVIEEI
ncbi:DUF4886 domain-containing protein [Sphingobacterium faecale]|uniref:DUF4886 domain-containing protein n=1 Tax=Sphingobacterium faecale TaxID=2803775 RepID=A0ABS1R3I6_9SPHI|nr:DUF4886 domain-containing protein [Sphingobacterium faecale]MBL1409272.1 DUF4886 domain-containing protein [Sphingobacterium faecale]